MLTTTILGLWLFVSPFINQQYMPTTVYNPDTNAIYLTEAKANNNESLEEISKQLTMMPENTKIISFEVKDNIGYLNLSHEFIESNIKGSTNSIMTVYSIIDTFCSSGNIKAIQFLVEGEIPEILFDGIDSSVPIKPIDYSDKGMF